MCKYNIWCKILLQHSMNIQFINIPICNQAVAVFFYMLKHLGWHKYRYNTNLLTKIYFECDNWEQNMLGILQQISLFYMSL